MDLVGELNRLAGLSRDDWRGAAGAANLRAGTQGLELVGALNALAGIPVNGGALELNGVLQRLGLTTDRNGIVVDPGNLQNTLRLPGIAGNYLSTPDTAAISVTGDIDIRVKVAMDSWRPPKASVLVARWGPVNLALYFTVGVTGFPAFTLSPDGTTQVSSSSTVGVDYAAGSTHWLRVTWRQSDGRTQFFTSEDGSTWAQLGADRTVAAASIFDNASPFTVGASGWGSDPLAGHVYYAEVRSGIDGNVVAKFDSSTVQVRGDRTPTTHTQNSAAEAIRLPGVAGNYLSIADSAASSVTGDIDIRCKVSPIDDWTPAAHMELVAKWGAGGSQSYVLRFMNSGTLGLFTFPDLTTGRFSTTSVPFAAGQPGWVRATLDVDNGAGGNTVVFYTSTDGASWTQLGDPRVTAGVTSIADTAEPLTLGLFSGSVLPFHGNVYEAQVRSGIDGPIVASFNAANTTPTAMRTPATTSDGWTVNGTGWSWDAPTTAPSSGALRLPGTAGNYVSTPDAADISITGDIDLRAKVTLDDWTPGGGRTLLAKYASGQISYIFRIEAGNALHLGVSGNGTSFNLTDTASSVLPSTRVADGGTMWVRATRVSASGQVIFYTSDDGSTWSQLGATAGGVAGAIFDGTAPLTVGAHGDNSEWVAGYVHRAEVYNGIGGTLVASFDAANVPITAVRTPTTVVQSGRTWTLNGSAWSWVNTPDPTEWTYNGADWWHGTYTGTQRFTQAIQLDEQYVQFPGTAGNYASTPDSAALSITGDIDIRAKVALDDWSPATTQALVAKLQSGSQRSFRFLVGSGGPSLEWSADGSATLSYGISAGIPFSDGQTGWLRVTLDVDNGASGRTVTFYSSTDGVSWTTLGSPGVQAGVTSIFDSTSIVEIGSSVGGTSQLLAGKVYYAEIRNGINGAIVGWFAPARQSVTAVRTPTTVPDTIGNTWTLNGSAWSWGITSTPTITAPDSAALSITGDIDLRAQLTLPETTVMLQSIISKRSGVTGGYAFRLVSDNSHFMQLAWADGTNTRFAVASTALTFTKGLTIWVRVTLDVDNGSGGHTVRFYTSIDGIDWTILGVPVNAGAFTTSIADTADMLHIGGSPTGGSGSFFNLAGGTIHYAEIRNGINGTVVGVFNPGILRAPYDQTPTTLKSPTGEQYTISGSGWRWVTSEV